MSSSFGLYTLFIPCLVFAFSSIGLAAPVESSLGTRALSGKATYFAVGLGSCGLTNVDSDYIVALSPAIHAQGDYCNKKIRITHASGATAVAMVRDTCPGCGTNDLDMSPSLFSHFEPLDKGVFQMKWSFI